MRKRCFHDESLYHKLMGVRLVQSRRVKYLPCRRPYEIYLEIVGIQKRDFGVRKIVSVGERVVGLLGSNRTQHLNIS